MKLCIISALSSADRTLVLLRSFLNSSSAIAAGSTKKCSFTEKFNSFLEV